ncbi:hypothetical protein HYH03_006510 [Edaphochlamys debaryana]|uniref:RHOMBOID-like protein n=1 Tax=Edaphochlamys debaryana TaxID=47281 RepID=A0A836C0U7_9CHLO|nr:hypothetical protein HYH03_006510 [Edaphochlamys debaryana]|eukprot:KAG2495237.1 hypothetical protein HYH03_006510 [Edaphochlamys debaryana]
MQPAPGQPVAPQQIQLVEGLPLQTSHQAEGVYVGSTSAYWAAAIAQQQDYERAQLIEREQLRVRRHLRIFAFLYNTLCVAELVYFIVGLYIVDWQVADLEDNPLLGPGQQGVIEMGGTHTQKIVYGNQWWRLITSIFYNAGAIHLTANLGMTWMFGHYLARELSPWTVAAIFLTSGLAGEIFSANIGADYMTCGASIPAFGLAGAACAMLIFWWRWHRNHWATALVAAAALGLNAFIGATPFVDNSGNTAGFVFGAALCLSAMLVRRHESKSKGREVLLLALACALLAAVIGAMFGGVIGLLHKAPVGGCCNPWVCAPSDWWDCDAARIWPTSCGYTVFPNTTSQLTCPRGQVVTIGVVNGTVSETIIQGWCDTYCKLASSGGVPTTGGDGRGSSGVQRRL